MSSIVYTGVIERKHPALPRYVVVPGAVVEPWRLAETTTVEGTFNGVDLGRRGIKRWDENWFVEIPDALCRKAGVDTGATVRIEMRQASTALPAELEQLLAADAAARDAWNRLTPAQQRMHRENVAAAKEPATRVKRARSGLGL